MYASMVSFHVKQMQVLTFGVHEMNIKYMWCGKEVESCSCVGDSAGGSWLQFGEDGEPGFN